MNLSPTPILMYGFPCLPRCTAPLPTPYPHPRTKKYSITSWVSTVQLNSVAIYLERTLYPKSHGLSLVRVPPPQYFRGQLPAHVITNQLQIGGSTNPFLRFNFLKWLTKLREILYLPNYGFTVR